MQPKLPAYTPAIFTPIDPTSLQYISVEDAANLALNYDRAAYNTADASWRKNQRELYDTFRREESHVLDALEGNIAPAVQSSFVTAALAASGPVADNAPAGSLGNFAVARSLANNANAYRQNAQDELGFLNQLFPERTLGLGGQGAIEVLESNNATYNETLATNNLNLNATNTANAVGQFNRDYAEYLREYSRPRTLGIGWRTLDGLYTGWEQGSTYGTYAGIIIAILGAIDGAGNLPLYRYRFEHQRDTEFSANQYGANPGLAKYGAYQEALSGQLGPNAPANVAALPNTSGLYQQSGPTGAQGRFGNYGPTGATGRGG